MGTSRAVVLEDRGQATVEAAFVIPIVMTLFLLLLQPGIILYDRMVMAGAAAEACRVLSTLSSGDETLCDDMIRRRLSAIPEQDLFHIHRSSCSWKIDLVGNEASSEVSVSIANEIEPVPLVGALSGLLGLTNASGHFEIHVEASMPTQPDWAQGRGSPSGWIGSWG